MPPGQLPAQSAAPADHQHARALPGSVGADALQAGSVTSDAIATGAVGADEIAADSVGLSELVAAVEQALVPTGSIVAYGGTSAPSGWLLCDGASLLRADFAALFAVLGTAFGAVDGTHFNVPDLRQRFPLGKAVSGTGATLGGTGGLIDHVHNLDTASSHARITELTAGTSVQIQRKAAATWNATHATGAAAGAGGAGQTTGAALGGDSDVANPPFQAVNYLVKT